MNPNVSANGKQTSKFAAFGGVLSAVAASSCCIAPLVLVTFGVGGAWVGNLTALKAYQPIFVTVTLVFIGVGFWQVYGKRSSCEDGSCDSALSSTAVKTALWIATGLVLLAMTVDVWAPWFY